MGILLIPKARHNACAMDRKESGGVRGYIWTDRKSSKNIWECPRVVCSHDNQRNCRCLRSWNRKFWRLVALTTNHEVRLPMPDDNELWVLKQKKTLFGCLYPWPWSIFRLHKLVIEVDSSIVTARAKCWEPQAYSMIIRGGNTLGFWVHLLWQCMEQEMH